MKLLVKLYTKKVNFGLPYRVSVMGTEKKINIDWDLTPQSSSSFVPK